MLASSTRAQRSGVRRINPEFNVRGTVLTRTLRYTGAPASGWGAQYGGLSSDTCSELPKALQSGCEFRFGDWFEGADNPKVDWEKVTCPKAITDKTGCVRTGETPTSVKS